MTDKKMTGREILIAAMEQYDITYCNEFPPIEAELQFDKECEKNLRKLMRRLNNPFRNYFNTAGKRAAGIAVAILVFFGCSMTVSAVHKPIVEFLMEIAQGHDWFRFSREDIVKAPQSIEVVYALDIPDDYKLAESKDFDTWIERTWLDCEGNEIFFSQETLGHVSTLDNETADSALLSLENGQKIVCREKHNKKSFFWNTNEYQFFLSITGDFSQEECLQIIESMFVEKGEIE